MTVLVLIAIGLVLGSFANALVWRLRNKRNWWSERSECTHCHHVLAARDLIPVVSWLMLRGKCRYCRKRIEDSPLVELALPVLFVLSYAVWPVSLAGEGAMLFLFWLVFLVGFMVLAVYDIRWFLLPNKIVFPLIGLAVVQVLAQVLFFDAAWRDLLGAGLGVLVISGIFYVFFTVSKGAWIGFGDVKLGFVLGILAGGPPMALLLLFLASLFGMVYSLPLVVLGKAKRQSHIPFGPFLLMAMVVVYLFGASMIDWYKSLVLA